MSRPAPRLRRHRADAPTSAVVAAVAPSVGIANPKGAPATIPCPCCGRPIPEVDWRPVPVRWAELVHLVDGARARGWDEESLEYLRQSMGLAWAKAFRRGEVARAGEGP